MMGHAAALKAAIDLVQVPSRVRSLRSQSLPEGLPLLLGTAFGDGDALREAVEITGRSPDVVCEAAAFFIEQILFSPTSDSYRVLGATPEATSDELRRNMALLLRWLHPDMDRRGERSLFVGRVTKAWNDLKTPERRAAYDVERKLKRPPTRDSGTKHGASRNQASSPRLKTASQNANKSRPKRALRVYRARRDGLLLRALYFLLGRARY
jgi:hypothetical protein